MIERPSSIVSKAIIQAAGLSDAGRIKDAQALHDMVYAYQANPTADKYDLLHNLMQRFGA